MIREPAAAAAAAICWLARWQGQGAQFARVASHRHPAECAWCAYPPATLIAWIEEFNDLDLVPGADPAIASSHSLGAWFVRLARDRQRELVDAELYPVAIADRGGA